MFLEFPSKIMFGFLAIRSRTFLELRKYLSCKFEVNVQADNLNILSSATISDTSKWITSLSYTIDCEDGKELTVRGSREGLTDFPKALMQIIKWIFVVNNYYNH